MANNAGLQWLKYAVAFALGAFSLLVVQHHDMAGLEPLDWHTDTGPTLTTSAPSTPVAGTGAPVAGTGRAVPPPVAGDHVVDTGGERPLHRPASRGILSAEAHPAAGGDRSSRVHAPAVSSSSASAGSSASARVTTIVAKDGTTASLRCRGSSTIQPLSAIWWSEQFDCEDTVMPAVRAACQGRASCTVKVTKPALGVDDPCPGAPKALKVRYLCGDERTARLHVAATPSDPRAAVCPPCFQSKHSSFSCPSTSKSVVIADGAFHVLVPERMVDLDADGKAFMPPTIKRLFIDVGVYLKSGLQDKLAKERDMLLWGFEPNQHFNRKRRKHAGLTVFPVALSNHTGHSTFHLWSGTGASLAPVTDEEKKKFRSAAHEALTVPVMRLQTFLTLVPRRVSIEWMKVDAQGHDMNVLVGAGAELKRIRGITAECQDLPSRSDKRLMYVGGCLVSDMRAYMAAQGFSHVECIMQNPPIQEVNCHFGKTKQDMKFAKHMFVKEHNV